MIKIFSKPKTSLTDNARRAINNAHSNSTSVEWNDGNGNIVIVSTDSDLKKVSHEMKVLQVQSRIKELTPA